MCRTASTSGESGSTSSGDLAISGQRRRYSLGRESRKDREREREFAEQAEIAYRRLVTDWQPTAKKHGAGATRGRAS